jgi:transposase-like protein
MAGVKGKSGKHGNATGPTRKPIQRLTDKAEMVKLLRRGWTKTAIAEKLGVHRTQVVHDWKQILEDLVETRDQEVNQLVVLKLEELGEVKREAWDAWERSKLDREKTVREDWESDSGSGSTKEIKTREGQVGEARYLDTVLKCIAAERELLGLNPKKSMEITGTVINWDSLVSTVQVSVETGTVPDLIEEQIRQLMEEGREEEGVSGGVVIEQLPGTGSLSNPETKEEE